jgi:beta-D-xylosidase 4
MFSNAPGVPRLGLPAYEWWSEALHGVASSPGTSFARGGGEFSYATSFAQPILTAAAFDDDAVEEIASVISTEARAFNNAGRAALDFFTPNINPYRDPRWGRGQETPGEDPFRTSEYARRLLLGLEGGQNPKVKKILAICKHFVGYDLEQAQSYNGFQYYNRFAYNAEINTQDLAEYYLPPFQQCARDSKVSATAHSMALVSAQASTS